jgi:hypothetical protein
MSITWRFPRGTNVAFVRWPPGDWPALMLEQFAGLKATPHETISVCFPCSCYFGEPRRKDQSAA